MSVVSGRWLIDGDIVRSPMVFAGERPLSGLSDADLRYILDHLGEIDTGEKLAVKRQVSRILEYRRG